MTILLDREAVQRSVVQVANRLSPRLDNETIVICLLVGGLWFAADLTRALTELGFDLPFDALWLASYGDAKVSGGRCQRLAGPQRPVNGKHVLLVDDVVESGLSLAEASRLLRDAGAAMITSVVFARKSWSGKRLAEPDYVAWEAPAKFLVGYGMDAAGRSRALSFIATAD